MIYISGSYIAIEWINNNFDYSEKTVKHMKRTLLNLLVALTLLHTSAWAQEGTVTGKVTTPEGSPLPGVNVLIKGTANGTITDTDGN
jgi:hypothetical protein